MTHDEYVPCKLRYELEEQLTILQCTSAFCCSLEKREFIYTCVKMFDD